MKISGNKIAYKIKWRTGGETAERYSSKQLAQAILDNSNLSGRIIKTRLGRLNKSSPSTRLDGGRIQRYPSGMKRVWKKSRVNVGGIYGYVYRTEVVR